MTLQAPVVRPFAAGDEAALMAVFQSAIRQVASGHYSPAQINAWAPLDMDPQAWAARMQALHPYVAVLDDVPVGYADLQPDGYIDHFFVSGHHPRQGIGRALMLHIFDEAQRRAIPGLHSHVSLAAQAFFATFGFRIVEVRTVAIRGVELQNALMQRP